MSRPVLKLRICYSWQTEWPLNVGGWFVVLIVGAGKAWFLFSHNPDIVFLNYRNTLIRSKYHPEQKYCLWLLHYYLLYVNEMKWNICHHAARILGSNKWKRMQFLPKFAASNYSLWTFSSENATCKSANSLWVVLFLHIYYWTLVSIPWIAGLEQNRIWKEAFIKKMLIILNWNLILLIFYSKYLMLSKSSWKINN